MMKKVRSWTAYVLVLILILSVGTACSPQEKKESTDKTKASDQKEDKKSNETKKDEKKEKAEPVVLKIVTNTQPNNDAPVVKAVEEKYNVKFDWDWVVDNKKFNEVMGVKLSGGDMPDVISLPDSGDINKYIKQGIVAEITNEMKAKIPSYFKVMEAYDTEENNLWVDAMHKGKLYGLKPISSQGAYPTILVWHKDWLKKVGIDKMPTTLDEFETAVYKFAEEDPDGDGQADTYGFSETTFNTVFGAYGAIPLKTLGKGRQVLYMTKKDGQVTFACIQPEMKEALAKLQQYYKDGIIDPEFVTGENKGGYWATSHAFINGRVGVTGMVLSTHWNPPLKSKSKGGAVYEEMMAANPDAKFGETFDIGGAVKGPEGKVGTHKWGAVNSNVLVLTTECVKDPAKVNAVLQMIEDSFSDYEYYTLLTRGIEGVHYTIDENGNRVTDKEKFPKTADLRKEGIYILNLIQQPEFRKKQMPEYYEFIEKYDGPGYADARYPKTEAYSKNISALERLTVQTYMDIIIGEKDIDSFDQYVETFKANGGDLIEKEINAQIAENLGK